jgi:hypothetical protein
MGHIANEEAVGRFPWNRDDLGVIHLHLLLLAKRSADAGLIERRPAVVLGTPYNDFGTH